MEKAQKQKVVDLLASQNVLTIATQGEEWPTATLQAFAETLDLDIVLIMLNDSVKFQNLRRRPKIALIIDDRDRGDAHTLQIRRVSIRGVAQEIAKGSSEWQGLQSVFLKKNPFEEPFFSYEALRMVRVTPQSLTYANGTSEHFTIDF